MQIFFHFYTSITVLFSTVFNGVLPAKLSYIFGKANGVIVVSPAGDSPRAGKIPKNQINCRETCLFR